MILLGKIYSEGYCCLYGYLSLCRARGEKARDMAENLEIRRPEVIYHAYRKLDKGKVICPSHNDCLKPVLIEIEKAP